MKKNNRKRRSQSGQVIVRKEDYRKGKHKGFREDEILKPGTYRFRRGSFAELHESQRDEVREAMKPHNVKVGVYIKLDLDILDFFKSRAGKRGAAPYQTQINAELRRVMEASRTLEGLDTLAALTQARELIDRVVRRRAGVDKRGRSKPHKP